MFESNDRSNRFEPDKVGFINFWVYENEVYPFHKGNILFRGQNGQGKSVSMQSIVPLLLDGNTHPSRIDPFGSGKRKIGDYLKTNDSLDKGRIAYIYISYKKIKTNEVVTTGIGLRAVDETRVDFWGFVIKGKEIGSNFPLTKSVGYNVDGLEEFIPLTKNELKRQIEEMNCGRFVNTQREYAEEVNKQVFQFENVESFKELTKLLIQIRSPKLSKEMKPDTLYSALKKSLAELPASDFSMLANTIKDIDDHNQKLKKTSESLSLAGNLLNYYKDYRKSVLGNASKRYLQAYNEQIDMTKKIDKNEKILIASHEKLKFVTDRLMDIEFDKKAKQEKLVLLETSSSSRAIRDDIAQREEELERNNKEVQHKEMQLEKANDKHIKFKDEKEKAETECDKLSRYIQRGLSDLEDLAEEIQFQEGTLYLANARKTLNEPTNDKSYFEIWNSRVDSHIDSLKSVLTIILEEQQILDTMKEKKEDLHRYNSEIDSTEIKLNELAKKMMGLKESFKSDFKDWVNSNKEFLVNQLTISEITVVVDNLFEFSDMTPEKIHNLFSKTREDLMEPLKVKELESEHRIKKLRESVTLLKEDIQALENEKDIQPPLSTIKKDTVRLELANNNIPYLPFYEAVDFKEHVSDIERERIESALMEMGLLDGIIIPGKYKEVAKKHDAVIIPSNEAVNGNTLSNALIPVTQANIDISESDIQKVLLSVSMDRCTEGTYITASGKYRHGLLEGTAIEHKQATYIGKEARRRYREQLIANINLDIQGKELEIGLVEEEVKVIKDRQLLLKKEYEHKPNLDEVGAVHREIISVEDSIRRLHDNKNLLTSVYEALTKKYQVKRMEKIEKSTFLEGPKDKETITQLIDLSENEYKKISHDIQMNFFKLENRYAQFKNATQHVEDAEDTIIEVQGEINILQSKLKYLLQILKNLKEELMKEGAQQEENEIEALRKDIQLLDKEEKEKIKEEPTIQEEIKRTNETITRAKKEWIFLDKQLMVQQEVFGLELKANDIPYEEALVDLAKRYKHSDIDIFTARTELDNAIGDFKLHDLEGYSITTKEGISGTSAFSVEESQEKEDRIQVITQERKRLYVTLYVNGSKKNPIEFYEYLTNLKIQQESYLKRDEEELIKKVMIQGLGEKIRELITRAVEWKNDINAFMKSLNNSIELRLLWEPIDKNDRDTEDHLTTSHLVKLLGRDFSTLKDSDIEALSKHFMTKINLAKNRLERKNSSKEGAENLEHALKQVLDYRDWYKFKIMYTLPGDKEKVLDENNLNILSGGEKAMAIYIPLFSAAYSKYNTSSQDAPYIIALDEAFAGVDEDNIAAMFKLMEDMNFNYILTSQAIWADYPTVSGINIYELSYDKVEKFVFSEPWIWDGNQLEVNNDVLYSKGVYKDESNQMHGDTVQESLFSF